MRAINKELLLCIILEVLALKASHLSCCCKQHSACYKLPLHPAWDFAVDVKVEELRTAHAFLGSIPGLGRSPSEGKCYLL